MCLAWYFVCKGLQTAITKGLQCFGRIRNRIYDRFQISWIPRDKQSKRKKPKTVYLLLPNMVRPEGNLVAMAISLLLGTRFVNLKCLAHTRIAFRPSKQRYHVIFHRKDKLKSVFTDFILLTMGRNLSKLKNQARRFQAGVHFHPRLP